MGFRLKIPPQPLQPAADTYIIMPDMLPFSLGQLTIAQDEETLHDLPLSTPSCSLLGRTQPENIASRSIVVYHLLFFHPHLRTVTTSLAAPVTLRQSCLQMTINLRYPSRHTSKYKYVFLDTDQVVHIQASPPSVFVFNPRIRLEDVLVSFHPQSSPSTIKVL